MSSLIRELPYSGTRTWWDETGGWSVTDHLLAHLGDRLDLVHRDLHGIGGSKRPPKPNPVPRPNDPKPKKLSFRELAQQLVKGGRHG